MRLDPSLLLPVLGTVLLAGPAVTCADEPASAAGALTLAAGWTLRRRSQRVSRISVPPAAG